MKPSYNTEACKSLSFEVFKELHLKVDYFKYLTDAQWQAEYATATGGEVVTVSNTTETVKVRPKPQKKRGS